MKIRNWTIFMAILVVLIAGGFQTVVALAETPPVEDVAAAFEAAWNEGDINALDAIAALGLVVHDPPGPDLVGLDAYKAYVVDSRNGVPDAFLLFEEAGVFDDRMYMRWMYGGTHTGESEFLGPPTGRPFTMTGATAARFANGKLVEMWHNADDLGMMMQLGMELVPMAAPVAWEMEQRGLRPDAPAYAVSGPYAVGVRNFEIPATQENERDLTATVWYPTLNSDGLPENYGYEMSFEPGDLPNLPVYGHAIDDADPAIADGPFPLVVHSHAWGTFQHEFPYLSENLASHGFVVISASHEDDWSKMPAPAPWQSKFRRPDEVRREIDFADILTAPDGALAGVIDIDHVGVTGWSHGAETTLVAAGARMDLGNYRAWCETNSVDGIPPDDDCPEILDHEEELAAFFGLDAVPEGLWPKASDPRIDAAAPLAPTTDVLGPEGVKSVDVPTLFILGSGDNDVGPGYREYDPYAQVDSGRKAEVLLDGASHLVFFSECEDMPGLTDIGFHFLCSDPIWDINRAHDLTNHFVTAFMLAELKGDAAAAAALAPESVDFPGIDYQAEGYEAAATALDPDLTANIETYIEEAMTENEITGLSIGIVLDGQLAYAKGFGLADLESGEAVTPQTLFQLAEVSMTPTSIAVLQLVEEGKVDLDAPITDYLPYFEMADPAFSDITIRQMLMHTSGIPDSGDTAADWSVFVPEYDDEAVERLVRGLVDREMLFAPDEGWEYSDIAFMVLGDLIAKVSGQSYEAYMAEHVFAPLGMDASTFVLEEIDPAMLAKPHVPSDDGPVVSEVYPYSRQFAASNNLFSNLEDMARFVQANLKRGELDGARILSENAYDLMWAPTHETPYGAPWSHWGMGWFTTEVDGYPVVWMGGADRGFEADAMLCPDENLAVIVMSNGPNSGDYYTPFITSDVLEMIFDHEAVE